MGAKSKAAHETLWCCGSLHTASIAVGVANIITVVMVTSHYIESELQNKFSFEIIAMSAVAVFLMVSSCLMLYGVIHQMSWLLLPWMVRLVFLSRMFFMYHNELKCGKSPFWQDNALCLPKRLKSTFL